VAAVAALILSVNNNLSSKEVGDIIEKTARKVGGYTYSAVSGRPNGTWNDEVGYGLVDAYEAVMEAKRRL
jgi:subtilisin family serine protease